MRLIDADAKALNPETINGVDFDTAIKEVETFLHSDECKYPLHIYLRAVRDFAEWYRDELKEAPTIDAVPVVRGKWTTNSDYPDTVICSLCGYKEDMWWADKGTNYCPNCGAKTDKYMGGLT